MAYDYAAAKASGLTDKEISEYLSGKANYNLQGAIEAGLSYEEINNHLVNKENIIPVVNKENTIPVVNKQNTAPEAPGMISELRDRLAQRGKDIKETLVPSPPIYKSARDALAAELQAQFPNVDPRTDTNFGTGLNLSGDIAGTAGDVMTTGLEAVYKGGKYLYDRGLGILVNDLYNRSPDSVKGVVPAIKLQALYNKENDPITRLGLNALKDGVKEWRAFKESYSSIAKNIESIFNIGMLVGPNATAKVETTIAGDASRALTTAATQQAGNARFNYLRELISPLSANQRRTAGVQAAKEGKQLTPTNILPGTEEKEIIQVLENIPSIEEGVSFTKNNNNVLNAISFSGENLEKQLINSNVKIGQIELTNSLETAKNNLLQGLFIKPGSNQVLEGYVDQAISTMERIYSQERAKGVSDSVAMLRARKQFDFEITKAAGPSAYRTESQSILIQSARAVRNATNEILIAANPDIAIKKSLNEQHRLYQARDVLAEKAYEETLGKFGKVMQVVNDILPVKYKLAATLGIVGVSSATLPVLSMVGGVYGVYLGSRLVTGPAAKEALAKVLLASDRAIAATSNAKDIIALQAGKQYIEELISTMDMQDQQNPNAVQSQIPSGQPAFLAPLAPVRTPPLPGPVAQASPQDMPFNVMQGTGIAQLLRPQEAYRQAMTGIGGR